MLWQLQDAKNRLSQLLRDAETAGPQVISVRGRETAVVLSVKDYKKMSARKGTLVSFFRCSPWADVEMDLDRSKDTGRDVSL